MCAASVPQARPARPICRTGPARPVLDPLLYRRGAPYLAVGPAREYGCIFWSFWFVYSGSGYIGTVSCRRTSPRVWTARPARRPRTGSPGSVSAAPPPAPAPAPAPRTSTGIGPSRKYEHRPRARRASHLLAAARQPHMPPPAQPRAHAAAPTPSENKTRIQRRACACARTAAMAGTCAMRRETATRRHRAAFRPRPPGAAQITGVVTSPPPALLVWCVGNDAKPRSRPTRLYPSQGPGSIRVRDLTPPWRRREARLRPRPPPAHTSSRHLDTGARRGGGWPERGAARRRCGCSRLGCPRDCRSRRAPSSPPANKKNGQLAP